MIAAVNAAIGAYYYLRVVGVMYLRTPLSPPGPADVAARPRGRVGRAPSVTLALGVYPAPMLNLVREATTPRRMSTATADATPKR